MRDLRTAALFAVSLAVAALVAELTLRAVVGPPVWWRAPQERYVVDHELGHRLAPDQRAFTHDRRVTTNAAGLRGRDLSSRIEPGTVRLLALGDSQTFGNGLALEETWPHQLADALRERSPEARWRVVNGGLPASDTWQHAILLRRLSQEYAFHGFLLAFYANDVIPRPKSLRAPVTNGPLHTLAYYVKRSALATALLRAPRAVDAALGQSRGAAREQRIVTGRGAEDQAELVEAGWREVERSLGRMREIASARDAPLLVVVLPRRDQLHAAEETFALNRRIAAICERLGIACVDPLPALRRAAQTGGPRLTLPWDGHHTAAANALVAEAVVEPLLGLLRDRGVVRGAAQVAGAHDE